MTLKFIQYFVIYVSAMPSFFSDRRCFRTFTSLKRPHAAVNATRNIPWILGEH